MNQRIIILSLTVVAGLTFAATALIKARSAAAAEASLARLAPRQGDLTRQLARDRGRIAAAEAEQRRLQEMRDGKPGAPKPAQPGQTKVIVLDPKKVAAAEAIARTPWRDVVLEKNPELQARFLANRRREMGITYGPFLANAGLSPAQSDRFKDILVAAAESAMDLNSTMRARGLAETDPVVLTLRKQAEDAMHAAQRELIGEAGFQQLGEYERTLPMREFVGGLAASLVFSGDALNASQANQLTQILAEANEAYRQGARAASPYPDWGGAISARRPARESIDSETLLARVRTVLSPAQYVAFEAEILRTRTLVELFNTMRQTPGDPFTNFIIVGRN